MGREIGVTESFVVSQERIRKFADYGRSAMDSHDRERAEKNRPTAQRLHTAL